MAGFSIDMWAVGLDLVMNYFKGAKGHVGGAINTGVGKMGIQYEALVKKATPVQTGRLRSSITSETHGDQVTVGTNVEYASFVEYGTSRMEARHVEGGQTRVLGMGPFTYALQRFKEGVVNGAKEIAGDIENRFKHQILRGFTPTKPNLPFF